MRKKVIAVILAVLVFSLIAASAASLGGINTADLGADATVIAACDTGGVDVSYNWAYSPGSPGIFDVNSVDVSAIDVACNGFDLFVELGDGTVSLGSGSVLAINTAVQPINVTIAGAVDAEAVSELGIVISN